MAPGGHMLYSGPTRSPEGRCSLTTFFDASRGGGPRLREISPNTAEAVLELVSALDDESLQRVARIIRAVGWSAVGGANGEEDAAGTDVDAENTIEYGWRQDAWSSGFLTQLRTLTGRHWTLLLRHPLLLATNLAANVFTGGLCAFAFRELDFELGSGVLQRMGFLFFLGCHFLLTGLASLAVWRHERLLYFQERGVGCYSTTAFILAKTVCADAIPMRIMPTVVCAAICYPSLGLAGIGFESGEAWYGPVKAMAFVASLCVTSLVISATFSCIGILCESSVVAVLVAVLYALFTLLFSGFLANANHLTGIMQWVPYFSCLRYQFELVMSNELLGEMITVKQRWPPDPTGKGSYHTVPGTTIVNQYLGFNPDWMDGYARIIPLGTRPDDQISAPWLDLYIPFAWFVAAVALSIALLKYCVKDPH